MFQKAKVWNFHVGGYQVCEKWLKDRRGRKLTNDDITHYQNVVKALVETIRQMAEIDAATPKWPPLRGSGLLWATLPTAEAVG